MSRFTDLFQRPETASVAELPTSEPVVAPTPEVKVVAASKPVTKNKK